MLGPTGPVKISAAKPGSAAGHFVVLAPWIAAPLSIVQPAFAISSAAALPLEGSCATAPLLNVKRSIAARLLNDRTGHPALDSKETRLYAGIRIAR